MADFYIKRGDLLPELNAVLQDAIGPVNLAGATVRFHMRVPGSTGTAKVGTAATVVTAATGAVKYTWTGTDTDTVGRYYGEFEVTWGDARKQTFPNNAQLIIEVTSDLA